MKKKKSDLPPTQSKEMEKSYSVSLTEIEMKTIAEMVVKLYKLEDKANHPSIERTFHMMKAVDKFAKALAGENFILIEKDRLPV